MRCPKCGGSVYGPPGDLQLPGRTIACHEPHNVVNPGRLVYISGAITGATADEMQMFTDAKINLEARGYHVFNPPDHDIPDAALNEEQWTVALCRDIAIITDCYGIAVLGTYERSKGATFEIFTALSLRKKHILLDGQHDAWRDVVMSHVQNVQKELWKNVDRERFLHHTDIPHK